MENKILFVDDEANVLDSFRRNLSRKFAVETALGAASALEAIARKGPYAVVVSDLRMPGMDGIKFLTKVGEVSPNTVRIMLTGFADLDAAMAAVNEGRVFRFLTKPCSTEVLANTLEAALTQFKLVMAEKELLRGTLRGCVKVLTEILSLANPEAFGRSMRLKRLVQATAKELSQDNAWKFDLAVMLSQIGCMAVPEEIVSKKYSGQALSPEERQIFDMHPSVGANLLANIPRLEEVTEIIGSQNLPAEEIGNLSLGARLLHIALDFDDMVQCGEGNKPSLEALEKKRDCYGEDVFRAFSQVIYRQEGFELKKVYSLGLRQGMILAEDLRSPEGLLILAKGHELSNFVINRLLHLISEKKISEPLSVLEPI